jgi:predicted amidohydrolase
MSKLRISIIQNSLQWEDKRANLDMIQKIEGIPDNPELIILPEMFSTGFTMKKNQWRNDGRSDSRMDA